MALPVEAAPVSLERRDAAALWALDRLCFTDDIAFSLGTFRRLLRDQRLVGFWIGSGGVESAVKGGADGGPQSLVAFVMALREKSSADIVTLDVHPGHRRRGLGRALLRHLHAALRRSGTREVTLQVAEDNVGAQELYRDEGYAAVGVTRSYYGSRRDAVLMRLVLNK